MNSESAPQPADLRAVKSLRELVERVQEVGVGEVNEEVLHNTFFQATPWGAFESWASQESLVWERAKGGQDEVKIVFRWAA